MSVYKAPRFYPYIYMGSSKLRVRMLLNQRRFLCLNFSLNTIKMCRRALEGFRFICARKRKRDRERVPFTYTKIEYIYDVSLRKYTFVISSDLGSIFYVLSEILFI